MSAENIVTGTMLGKKAEKVGFFGKLGKLATSIREGIGSALSTIKESVGNLAKSTRARVAMAALMTAVPATTITNVAHAEPAIDNPVQEDLNYGTLGAGAINLPNDILLPDISLGYQWVNDTFAAGTSLQLALFNDDGRSIGVNGNVGLGLVGGLMHLGPYGGLRWSRADSKECKPGYDALMYEAGLRVAGGLPHWAGMFRSEKFRLFFELGVAGSIVGAPTNDVNLAGRAGIQVGF